MKIQLKYIGLLLLCLNLFTNMFSQSAKVNIGDLCPDVELTNIINYSTKTARISDFKGKVLILDFWTTWCSPCIKEFPKMDSLRKAFKDKIQIMAVSNESESSIQALFQNLGKKMNLPPSVIQDRVLNQMFPHRTVPHCVWINEKGIVIAFTSSSDVNDKNIELLLTGVRPTFMKKNDFNFERLKPLFGKNPQVSIKDEELIRYSVFTHYIEGLGGYSAYNNKTITAGNLSIKMLYQMAYGHHTVEWMQPGKVELLVKDTAKYTMPSLLSGNLAYYNQWKLTNSYCYELTVSKDDSVNIFEIMKHDLDERFNMKASIQNRKISCLVLSIVGDTSILRTKGGVPFARHSDYELTYRKTSFKDFLFGLQTILNTKLPFTDETGIPENLVIDISVNGELSEIAILNKELNQYGLQIKRQERDVKVLVLEENDNPRKNLEK